MYAVFDFYEEPFGEMLLKTESLEECKLFIKQFIEDTDGECILRILQDDNIYGKIES